MDELLCAAEVYPDFSLLEEVLLSPYFDSDQAWGHLDKEWTKLLSELHYCQSPRGVAAVNGECDSSAMTKTQNLQGAEEKLQYRRKTSRGRRRRCTGRFAEGKAKKLGSTHNYEYSGHRMSCMMPVLKPTVFHLLEESVRQLEKCIDTQKKDRIVQNTTSDSSQTSYIRDSYNTAKSPARISSNALEILNNINMECALINKLGQQAEDVLLKECADQNDCNLDINNNIPKLDRGNLSSTSKEQGFQKSMGSQFDPELKKCPSSTSWEVQSVKKTKERYQGNSLGSLKTRVYVQRTPRKQRTPMKSVEKLDPSFQGIEFQMHLCFDKEKCDDCQLIVSSVYSRGRNKRKSIKSRLRFKSTSLSSGSDDDRTPTASSKNKQCASCKTQKTPLWRDAEDGTPLCNACGIRYKKYGVRCGHCWNIPKKDGKVCSRYCGCGGMFRTLI